MKCTIEITGQINGNHRLLNNLGMRSDEHKKGMFNSYTLFYNRVGDAKKDIRDAFMSMRMDEPDFYKSGGISKSRDNSSIYYDASVAKVSKQQ